MNDNEKINAKILSEAAQKAKDLESISDSELREIGLTEEQIEEIRESCRDFSENIH